MSVNRPNHLDHIYRPQPIFGDKDDNRDNQKQKKVYYQGRSWEETEEELPVVLNRQPKQVKSQEAPIYADFELYKSARKRFETLTTLEEKIAQLCFYQTQAIYDQNLFQQTKDLIIRQQIGGILFTYGEYKRQTYLIENYQTIAKTPLLIGNDFHHAFSFFLNESTDKEATEQRYYDLGKVIMLQNLRMGVHFQCDKNFIKAPYKNLLTENERKAFRKGIRASNGIVGKFQNASISQRKRLIPQFSLEKGTLQAQLTYSVEDEIKEIIGLKTIAFFDLTDMSKTPQEDQWGKIFFETCEFFLFSDNIDSAIKQIHRAVIKGIIKEEEINKRVFKALLVKSLFF